MAILSDEDSSNQANVHKEEADTDFEKIVLDQHPDNPLLGASIENNIQTLSALRYRERHSRTGQDRIADVITDFSGNMWFVYLHAVFFTVWIVMNVGSPRSIFGFKPFDPYPFQLLTLIVSLEAIFLSTFVLISQNRMGAQSDKRAELDLHVGLLSEHEITRVIKMLDAIEDHLGISNAADAELRRQFPDVPPIRVVVVLDRCTDGSDAVVAQWPGVETLIRDFGNVGAARAAGVTYLLDSQQTDSTEWIACTDADSAVPPGWLLHQMSHARSDTDLLLGVVRPDAQELQPSSLKRWMSQYHLRDGHPHVHGANMGVRVGMYRRAGGFPSLAEHEDVVLARRIRALGGRVVSAAGHPVVTSARVDGRTPGGVAGYLRSMNPIALID